MTKDFQYVFLDLDGTITNPYEGITKSFKYALTRYGIDVDRKELLPVIGPPLIDSFCSMYGFKEEDGWDAVALYRERYERKGWRENKLIDGTVELLKFLKAQEKTVALATSKPLHFAEKILKEFDIYKYFDVVSGAEMNGDVGTKTQIIERTLEKLGKPDIEKVIMIGDRKYDIEGAKSFGMTSAGVRVGFAADGELETAGADYIFDTLYDLKDFLCKTVEK